MLFYESLSVPGRRAFNCFQSNFPHFFHPRISPVSIIVLCPFIMIPGPLWIFFISKGRQILSWQRVTIWCDHSLLRYCFITHSHEYQVFNVIFIGKMLREEEKMYLNQFSVNSLNSRVKFMLCTNAKCTFGDDNEIESSSQNPAVNL